MSTRAELQSKVEAEVEKGFLPVLIERLKHVHKTKYFRTCDCTFCILKRKATARIAGTKPYERDVIRKIYRERMGVQFEAGPMICLLS